MGRNIPACYEGMPEEICEKLRKVPVKVIFVTKQGMCGEERNNVAAGYGTEFETVVVSNHSGFHKRDDFSDIAVHNMLFDGSVKRSITHYIADDHFSVLCVCHIQQLVHFFLIYGEELFQKHIVNGSYRKCQEFSKKDIDVSLVLCYSNQARLIKGLFFMLKISKKA